MADGYSRVTGQARRVHRPERPGHHQLRHRDRGGLLGAQPGGRDHARDGPPDDRPGRLPGNRPAADLLEDHQVPGAREQPGAHGGAHGARLRPRASSRWGRRSSTSRATTSTARLECEIPQPIRIERGPGGGASLDAAAELLAEAKFPVIISGGGVVMARRRRTRASRSPRRSTRRSCNSYLHNDSFPASHPLALRAARLPRLEGGDEARSRRPTWCSRWARASGPSACCRSTASTTGRPTRS